MKPPYYKAPTPASKRPRLPFSSLSAKRCPSAPPGGFDCPLLCDPQIAARADMKISKTGILIASSGSRSYHLRLVVPASAGSFRLKRTRSISAAAVGSHARQRCRAYAGAEAGQIEEDVLCLRAQRRGRETDRLIKVVRIGAFM